MFSALDDHQNPRLIKALLQDLSIVLGALIREVGKSVLVGNINIWICRLETILTWQQQLSDLQIPKVPPTPPPHTHKATLMLETITVIAADDQRWRDPERPPAAHAEQHPVQIQRCL